MVAISFAAHPALPGGNCNPHSTGRVPPSIASFSPPTASNPPPTYRNPRQPAVFPSHWLISPCREEFSPPTGSVPSHWRAFPLVASGVCPTLDRKLVRSSAIHCAIRRPDRAMNCATTNRGQRQDAPGDASDRFFLSTISLALSNGCGSYLIED